MTNVQVRDVPPEVVDALKAMASKRQQSLQSYLLDLLKAEAAVETNRALFEEAAADAAGYAAHPDEAAEAMRQARQERDRHLGITR